MWSIRHKCGAQETSFNSYGTSTLVGLTVQMRSPNLNLPHYDESERSFRARQSSSELGALGEDVLLRIQLQYQNWRAEHVLEADLVRFNFGVSTWSEISSVDFVSVSHGAILSHNSTVILVYLRNVPCLIAFLGEGEIVTNHVERVDVLLKRFILCCISWIYQFT
jgi:hypothetical protein